MARITDKTALKLKALLAEGNRTNQGGTNGGGTDRFDTHVRITGSLTSGYYPCVTTHYDTSTEAWVDLTGECRAVPVNSQIELKSGVRYRGICCGVVDGKLYFEVYAPHVGCGLIIDTDGSITKAITTFEETEETEYGRVTISGSGCTKTLTQEYKVYLNTIDGCGHFVKRELTEEGEVTSTFSCACSCDSSSSSSGLGSSSSAGVGSSSSAGVGSSSSSVNPCAGFVAGWYCCTGICTYFANCAGWTACGKPATRYPTSACGGGCGSSSSGTPSASSSSGTPSGTSSSSSGGCTGTCSWAWDGTIWNQTASDCSMGCVTCSPPAGAGTTVGETATTPCVPAMGMTGGGPLPSSVWEPEHEADTVLNDDGQRVRRPWATQKLRPTQKVQEQPKKDCGCGKSANLDQLGTDTHTQPG